MSRLSLKSPLDKALLDLLEKLITFYYTKIGHQYENPSYEDPLKKDDLEKFHQKSIAKYNPSDEDPLYKEILVIFSESELSMLKEGVGEFPYINFEERQESKVADFYQKDDFNKFFDWFIYLLFGGGKYIDYFSPGLTDKQGNNNLDIHPEEYPGNQSAALLYNL